MKKSLLVVLGLMVVSLLVACGTKDGNEGGLDSVSDAVVNEENDVNPLADLVEKTPLTLEDLDRINEYKFPISYAYSTYSLNSGDAGVETGENAYSNNKFLLPIEEEIETREIVSSVMSHDRIYTTMDVTLKNGESYSVVYINDPDTLEYVGASVTTPTSTTSYTFNY